MKKVLIVFLISILLTSCTSKKSWNDVKEIYSDSLIDKQVIKEIIDDAKYSELLNQLKEYINDLKYSYNQGNTDTLVKIYKIAQYLELFSSLFNGNLAQQLLSLSTNVKDLVISQYDGNFEEFDRIKKQVQTKIDDLSNIAIEDWTTTKNKIDDLLNNFSIYIEKIK